MKKFDFLAALGVALSILYAWDTLFKIYTTYKMVVLLPITIVLIVLTILSYKLLKLILK